jgi:hypothetical protein
MTQKTHLQSFASTRNPPAIGPMIGPNNGPKDQSDIATPRLSGGIRSAIVPLPQVIGATPAKPARKRNTINIAMFLDTAHRMVKIEKRMLQA